MPEVRAVTRWQHGERSASGYSVTKQRGFVLGTTHKLTHCRTAAEEPAQEFVLWAREKHVIHQRAN